MKPRQDELARRPRRRVEERVRPALEEARAWLDAPDLGAGTRRRRPLVLALGLAGCGPGATGGGGEAGARQEIRIVGSSTVYPFTVAVAERFAQAGTFPPPIVESTGTGGGIFLSPLLILAGWATTRQASGIASAFILANSIAGLAGRDRLMGWPSRRTSTDTLPNGVAELVRRFSSLRL